MINFADVPIGSSFSLTYNGQRYTKIVTIIRNEQAVNAKAHEHKGYEYIGQWAKVYPVRL